MNIDQTSITEPRLLNGVDLRAFWETFKLRWWVIPAAVVLSVGVMWAQESNLQTEPAYYTLSQIYEAQDPTPLMLSLGVNPALVKQFPDPANQLLILQSPAEQEAVMEEIGGTVNVSIAKSPGSLTYEFRCTEESRSKCDPALVAFERRATALRLQGYTNGLNDLRAALVKLSETSTDASLPTTISAIDVLLRQLQTPLVLISESEEEMGATVTNVKRPTYLFGVAAGVVIAIVILLQLTFADSRIRSARQFARLIDHVHVLGWLPRKPDDIALRRTAVALHHSLARVGGRSVRFIPLRSVLADASTLEQLATSAGAAHVVESALASLAVTDLTRESQDEVDIIVVQRNTDRRNDLVEATAALERSGRRFGGAILVG